MNLSEEQILALAPDASSQKSGKELAASSKWVSKGANEKALWGECQGSGKNPYRTQIDRLNLAFKCSCPSRKFPCKHGMGLLLNHARNTGEFSVNTMPDWVSDWIDKRQASAEKKAEKKDKPVDTVAQAKRLQQRTGKVNDGLEELQLFIKDLVRNGILSIPEKGPQMFEHLAKRMVDAQAPGIATMLKGLAAINYYRDGWQSVFMDKLLRIYLVTEGFKRVDSLETTLQFDIRSMAGFNQSTDEVKQQEGIKDQWIVLGKQTSEEEQLIVQRNWLYGTNSKQYALVLGFHVRNQVPDITLTPGTCIDAELVFYKSRTPLRALIKKLEKTYTPTGLAGLKNWTEVTTLESKQFELLPFHEELPFLVEQVQLSYIEKQWFMADEKGALMKLNSTEDQLYKMLAMSGGKPFTAAVLEKETVCTPIGMWTGNQYTLL